MKIKIWFLNIYCAVYFRCTANANSFIYRIIIKTNGVMVIEDDCVLVIFRLKNNIQIIHGLICMDAFIMIPKL